MAPRKTRVYTGNPDLVRGIEKFSRSKMSHKRGIWAFKAKNGGAFPLHEKKETAASLPENLPKFYPADEVKMPLANHRKPKPTKLRLEPTTMGKKRKNREGDALEVAKNEEISPIERPKRSLLGWKEKEGDDQKQSDHPIFRNKENVLITCSRRITYRYRHLMLNVVSLLPHCKKDNKVESKESKGAALNELVELRNCSHCMFFECRKQKDLYMWMAKCPNGPSVKFLVNAVHTMEELKLTGNNLKGSRPILTFSSNFSKEPHWQLLKEMITQIFGTPKNHRKAKPFHDHVFAFSIADDHIWFRNYQIVDRGGITEMTLVEVGPRFCLNPIKIFAGSFGGPTLYENPFYISPNQIRSLEKKQKAGKFAKKIKAKTRRKQHELSNQLEPDEFADLWRD